MRLNPAQRWSFIAALMWSVGEESDGYIGHDDLDLIPGFDRSAVPALLEQRLLTETVGGWFVSPNGEPFEQSQTTKARLEQMRENNRKRQAKHRDKAQMDNPSVTPLVHDDVTPLLTQDQRVSNAEGRKLSKAKPSEALSVDVFKENCVAKKSGTILDVEVSGDTIRVHVETRELVQASIPVAVLRSRRVRDGLFGHAQMLLDDGASPAILQASLREWARRSGVYPGDLPHIYTEGEKRMAGGVVPRNGEPLRDKSKSERWDDVLREME